MCYEYSIQLFQNSNADSTLTEYSGVCFANSYCEAVKEIEGCFVDSHSCINIMKIFESEDRVFITNTKEVTY